MNEAEALEWIVKTRAISPFTRNFVIWLYKNGYEIKRQPMMNEKVEEIDWKRKEVNVGLVRYNKHKKSGGFTKYELTCSYPPHFKKQPVYRLAGTCDSWLAIPHEWYQDVLMFLIGCIEREEVKKKPSYESKEFIRVADIHSREGLREVIIWFQKLLADGVDLPEFLGRKNERTN